MFDVAGLRDRSAVLFGQSYRLEVMIAVAVSDGLVCLIDVQTSLGLHTASNLQKPWASLQEAELLLPADDGDLTKRRWLRRAESRAWAWALELAGQFEYDLPHPERLRAYGKTPPPPAVRPRSLH